MSFTQKLLLVVALLLCLSLSAGGGWMIHANFAAAVDTALADAAADQERARTSLEDALRGTEQVKETFRAAKNWAGQRMPGADAGFSVLREDGTLVYAAMPEGTDYLDQLRAVQAGAGGAVVSAGKPPALLLAAPLQTGAAENRPQAGLWLVTAYDLSAVWAEQARQLRQFVLIELGTLAAALAAAAAGARALTGPLRRLEAAAHAVEAGDYTAPAPTAGGPEFARLGAAFNAMTAAVRSRTEALAAENASRTRFVAAFTHELKTPMTAMLGYADLLRSGEPEPAARRLAADYIYHEAARLESLSRALLALLDVTEGPPPALEPAALAGVVAEAQRSLPGLPAQVEVDCPPEAWAQVNRPLLVDLVRNLLQNAAAARPADGVVRVAVTPQGAGWRLAVRDTGRGIPPEDLPHVTEAFYRVDKSRARQAGGSGLGLSLCAAIAEAHGAGLEIQSEPGVGTTVSLTLAGAEPRPAPQEVVVCPAPDSV